MPDSTERFRKFGLPILGVLETIATKGKSPGTTALNAESIFQQREDRAANLKKEEQAARDRALQRQLTGLKIRKAEMDLGPKDPLFPDSFDVSGLTPDEAKKALFKIDPKAALSKTAFPGMSIEDKVAQAQQINDALSGSKMSTFESKEIFKDKIRQESEERKRIASEEKKQKSAEKIGEATQKIVKTILTTAKEVPPLGRGFQARITGLLRSSSAVLGYNDAVSSLKVLENSLGTQIARKIGGETGVVTDRDRAYANQLIPKPGDTVGERALKDVALTVLADPSVSPEEVEQAIAEAVGSLSGTGLTYEDRKRLDELERKKLDELERKRLDELERKPGK
jgi:hypothetical protein